MNELFITSIQFWMTKELRMISDGLNNHVEEYGQWRNYIVDQSKWFTEMCKRKRMMLDGES